MGYSFTLLTLFSKGKQHWTQVLVLFLLFLIIQAAVAQDSSDDPGDPFSGDEDGLTTITPTISPTFVPSDPTPTTIESPVAPPSEPTTTPPLPPPPPPLQPPQPIAPAPGRGQSSPDCAAIADLHKATGPWRFTPDLTNCCNTDYPNSGSIKCNANNQIVYIYLAGQGLSGNLPDSLGSLASLRYLLLGYNSLSGPIPASLLALPLTILDLSHNQLSGSLPSIGGWTSVETLNLEANQLSGTVPDWLFTLPRLKSLALGQNQFTTGDTPPTVRFTLDPLTMSKDAMDKISKMDPSQVVAPPSTFLGKFVTLPRIAELKLDALGVSGTFPPSWETAMVNLTKLDLSSNVMQGILPQFMAKWTRMKTLLLNNNEFAGPIPSLETMPLLKVLDLSFNQLTGPIPPWAAGLNMTVLNLSNNLLSGTFPLDNNHQWRSCSVVGNYFVCTMGSEAALSGKWRSECRGTCTDTQQPVPLVRPAVDKNKLKNKTSGTKGDATRASHVILHVAAAMISIELFISLLF